MSERTARDVTARGVRMRVVESGAGRPLLLVHGFLVSHLEFDDVLDPLAERYRVVAPDLPGFGESEKPSPTRYAYGIEAFSEALADVIAAMELGRVSIVGHSMGGAVALTLAAEHPELVDRLVLVDALVYPFPLELGSRFSLVPVVGPFLFKQLYGRGTFRGYFREQVFARGFEMPLDRVDRYYDQFNTPAARESAYAVLAAMMDTRPVVARIPRVHVPTLVVWGRHDRLFPAVFGQRLAREIGGARLELLDAGHAPNEERPEELVSIVRAFLGD
jgi:pimeloyl-ACP methyl ester carboxylesterase